MIRRGPPGSGALLWWLVAPGLALLLGLMVAPIGLLAMESLRPYVPGRVGAGEGFTLGHYAELLQPAYAFYFWETFRLGLIVSVLAVGFGAPLAYAAARTRSPMVRRLIFGLLVGLLVMSLIARLYAIQMTWGSTGPLAALGTALTGIPARSPRYAEVQVVIGLLHFVLPVVALMLVGTFQNINPRLAEAAAALGATRGDAAMTVVLPLAAPGLISAFLLGLAMCISNFVVPLVLGRGVVQFTTSLMYMRFSEVGNYPSGAAIGIAMLLLAFCVVYGLAALVRRLVPGAGSA
jgi:putative spermidine/putrescine transport system permease protein